MNCFAEPSEDPVTWPRRYTWTSWRSPAQRVQSAAAPRPRLRVSQPGRRPAGLFAANVGWGQHRPHAVLLPFLLRRQGLSVEAIAAITALTFSAAVVAVPVDAAFRPGPRRRSFFIWPRFGLRADAVVVSAAQGRTLRAMLAALIAVNGLFTVASAALSACWWRFNLSQRGAADPNLSGCSAPSGMVIPGAF